MALAPGTRLGPYEILSAIGAGGMGEVYRARDTRLGREVAVKVLPEHLSASVEVRQRFEREARAVSSLNHPHICTLHDVGREGGVDYLVMELLDGETLAVRLKRGALPPREALRIGIQIAGALERAHRAGFVHRDLKPANIMITRGGAKLLDFGLARSLAGASGPTAALGSSLDPLTTSPTVARPMGSSPPADGPLTSQGAILGTYQYMAPEQIEGREADQRTDTFALGLVLYEMITGRRAFEAATQASLIAEILKGEPVRITTLAGASPATLDRLVQTCLRKDPDERFQSAHDVRLQLEWIAAAGAEETAGAAGAGTPGASAAPPPPKRRLRPPAWLVTGAAILAAIIGWAAYNDSEERLALATRPVTFSIEPPAAGETGFTERTGRSDFAIAPDGRKIAIAARGDGGASLLWVREMDRLDLRLLQGTEGADMPFWSPDSLHIGFFSQGKVKRVHAAGGPVQVLCDWRGGHGGTWSERDVILFGGEMSGGGVMMVPAGGGTPSEVTRLGAPESGEGFAERARHEWPVFLPGGDTFMYLQFSGRSSERAILVASLDGGEPRRLIETGFKAAFVEPDWLIYVERASLMAQRFDRSSVAMLGRPSVVLEGIDQAAVPGEAAFSISLEGHLAYRKAPVSWRSQLTWYSREGMITGTASDEGTFVSVSLAPDGRSVSTAQGTGGAYDGQGIGEAPVDIWNIDLARGVTSRFTARPSSSDENPVWSPDGRRIAFASHQNGLAAVYVRDASGAGEEALLLASDENPHPIAWSPDGRYLLLHAASIIGDNDLALLDLARPEDAPAKWLGGPGNQSQGQFSPDGRWIAYTSDEGGSAEVFVRPFPSGDGKWQISARGGGQPRWRGDGRELYFVAPEGTLMAVRVEAGPEFRASAPVALFRSEVVIPGFAFYGSQAAYDVAPGGERFLVNRDLDVERPDVRIHVILNWPRPESTGG